MNIEQATDKTTAGEHTIGAAIKVYYDGACPRCVQELEIYRRFERKGEIEWFDITGKDDVLRAEGIDPDEALKQLHIRMHDGTLVKEVDAFIVLWRHVLPFRPIAWIASIPPVKSAIQKAYARLTISRLRRSGRLCDDRCPKP